MPRIQSLITLAVLALAGCTSSQTGRLTLVESFPIETSLDHADLPQTLDVWLEMIASAETSIDLASFYASPGPELEPVVEALEDAGRRGVRVRVLVSAVFEDTYPELIDRFAGAEGIAVRVVDLRPVLGGVMHAKYMVVDEEDAFVGSANFDYRSLAHIQELGARVQHEAFAHVVDQAFRHDWKLAGGEIEVTPEAVKERAANYAQLETVPRYSIEVELDPAQCAEGVDPIVSITPALSPPGALPKGSHWDLPVLVDWIDAAESSVCVQVLTYRATNRDRSPFEDLDSALRRAAERGVPVRLIVADWSKRGSVVGGLKELQKVPGIDVSFLVIPQWSGGFVPFARVVHGKYAIVDGERVWLGSSNWEGDYFLKGRNVGMFLEGEAAGSRFQAFFEGNWDGEYAERVDPDVFYEAPRRE
ncbi:MAG: hypothetical protein GY711_02520 [bacterium]|nr:hypothetical protein [bacterium]